MKTPKVLLCAPSPSNKGGITIWSRTLLEYYNSGRMQHIELSFLPMDRSVQLSHLLPSYKKLWFALKDYFNFPYLLWNLLHKQEFNVAHITSVGGWMGSLRDLIFVGICKLCKVKSIIHYHCGTIPIFFQNNNWKWKLQNSAIKYSSNVLVLDEASLHILDKLGYKHAIKLPNPLPESLTQEVLDRKRKKRSILFVGHVVPTKGIYELLDAIKDLEDVSLDVFGPENSEVNETIKQQITNRQTRAKIVFHGKQPSEVIYKYMRNASLFVLPTYSEGFPLVILEAMACGCPIISTPVGAIKEMLTVGEKIAGSLVPVRDVDTLKNRIEYYLEHQEEALKMASLAKQKVFGSYTLDIVMKQLEHIWMQ